MYIWSEGKPIEPAPPEIYEDDEEDEDWDENEEGDGDDDEGEEEEGTPSSLMMAHT